MEVLAGQMDIFDFTIKNEEKHIKLPHKQILVILEGLYNLKKDIEESTPANFSSSKMLEMKKEEVETLIQIIEGKAEYDFNKMLDKCKKKKNVNEETGIDAFSASIELKH